MGADGMNDAGRVGFVIRGAYDSSASYDFLDVVYFGDSSYVAKKVTVGNEPTENNEYWQIFAKAAQGPAGPQGVKGDTGPAGPAGSNGATIYSGISAPGSSLGVNGDVYFQYS